MSDLVPFGRLMGEAHPVESMRPQSRTKDEEFLAGILLMFKSPLSSSSSESIGQEGNSPSQRRRKRMRGLAWQSLGFGSKSSSALVIEEQEIGNVGPKWERFGRVLARPTELTDYRVLIKWAIEQVGGRATAEEVFSMLRGHGWPALANPMDARQCRQIVEKLLEEEFIDVAIDSRSGLQLFQVPDREEIPPAGGPRCVKHTLDVRCPLDCHFERISLASPTTDAKKQRPKREATGRSEERAARREQKAVRAKKRSSSEGVSTSNENAKDAAKPEGRKGVKGRRWIRFACDKHRKEHGRCPDNCVMRKKSYSEDEGPSSPTTANEHDLTTDSDSENQ